MKDVSLRKRGIEIGIVIVLIALSATIGAALPFQKGDIFAAIANGQVQHYNSSGFLLETLNTGLGGFNTGMAFDSSGNLYVTDFSASNVSVFNNTGALLGTFGSGYSTPESILFNATGTVYVGNLGNGIRKFDSTGNFLATVFGSRTDWMDLASDQCTMLITNEGPDIQSHNVCSNTVNPNFATSMLTNGFALRILSDGGVLVGDQTSVKRFNSTGAIIQTYNVTGNATYFALNLDPDGTSFWSGDPTTGWFFKFDIASGNVLMSVNTGKPGSFFGLVVFGEITAGGGGVKTFSLSGYKINDTNGDGLWNVGELGIAGWNITLKNATTNAVIGSILTNANGFYNFLNLANGTYNVTEEARTGWVSTNATFKVITISGQDVVNQNFTNKIRLVSSFTVTKDFRFTDVNFTAIPAQLGNLLPHTDSNYSVKYVLKPKDGTVSSTNPGQLYGVITINGTGVSNMTVNDTFGTQFDVNPAKLGGGVEVLRVNTTTGVATILTNTPQIAFASVDNTLNTVKLTINLSTPLAADEKVMVYIKFMTSLKGSAPDFSDFVNNAIEIINNGSPLTATATIKFV